MVLCGQLVMCTVQIMMMLGVLSWTVYQNSKSKGQSPRVLGYFTVIKFPHEKRGGTNMTCSVGKVSDFINENELIDLPPIGKSFIWSSNQAKVVISRFYRLLNTLEWEKHCNGALQMALQRQCSDHWPILLTSKEMNCDSRPFRFENC